MQRRSRLVVALGLVSLALAPLGAPVDASAIRTGSVTGWVPYWEATTGTRALQSASDAALFAEVSPFWFSATTPAPGTTAIAAIGTGANLKMVVDAARARGLLVMPSVTDGTGKLVMQAILADPVTRSAHIDSLVDLVLNGFDFAGTAYDGITYDGIDLDYEGFAFADGKATWPQTQPGWLAFVKELGERLHANGKLLSITVPPIWDDGASGYTVYGPWEQITPYADRLRLMVYDWSVGSPGPVAPMSWVRNVLAYVRKTVPAADLAKVWLGVPTYGRSWAKITGECPTNADFGRATTSIQSSDAAGVAASHHATITDAIDPKTNLPEGEKTFTWPVGTFSGTKVIGTPPGPYVVPPQVVPQIPSVSDSTTLEVADRLSLTPTITVQVTCTVQRVVYYPDNASVVQRSQAAAAAGLGGIVIWALGYEPLDLWSTLAASG